MHHKYGGNRTVQATETAFDIIETLQNHGTMKVTELAEAVDMAPSSVHGHLTTLLQKEYVVKEDHEYRLGLKFTRLGRDIRFDLDIVSAARAPLEELARDTDEEAWLHVEENGHSVAVMQEVGSKSIESVGMISRYTPIHNNGAGKALLAHLPEERMESIVDEHGLPASTDQTITDRAELRAELDQIREQGYALSDQERYEGVRSVFSPIVVGGTVLGAVGIAGPSSRLCGELFREELPNRVMEASNEIELKLRYPKFNVRADS